MQSENSTAYVRSAMLRSKEIVLLGVSAGAQSSWSRTCWFRASWVKRSTEPVEYIVGGLSRVVDPGEFTAEDGCVEEGGLGDSGGGERSRVVDRDAAGCVDDAGPEPDGRTVPLADAPDAHHESQAACDCRSLVGMGHDAGVAQRRTFNGVFAGERRAQQQLSRLGEFQVGIESVGEFRACRRKVPARSRWRPSKRMTTSSSEDRTCPSSRARIRASTAPARDSWCSNPSWPGTKSRVMTRDGLAASRWGCA